MSGHVSENTPGPIPRLNDRQRLALRALLARSDSDHLSYYLNRSLPSLERRGLVVQQGGRRPQGRAALRVLSAGGRAVADALHETRETRP
jgi:hypothetical protein